MQEARNNHIIIAGTGRTGTTFLVQYLTELGLDTHVARHGIEQLEANANAGLEDMPLLAEALPYVIKAPWIGEYIDEILAAPDIRIDAAILPMRDIVEAAASRTILELRSLHQKAPWMAKELSKTWENWATTPGGHNLLAQSHRSGAHLSRRLSPSCPAPGRCGDSDIVPRISQICRRWQLPIRAGAIGPA